MASSRNKKHRFPAFPAIETEHSKRLCEIERSKVPSSLPQRRQIEVEVLRIERGPAHDAIHLVRRDETRQPRGDTVRFQVGHESLQAIERGRDMGRRRRFIAAEHAERGQLCIDRTAAVLIQPAPGGALRAAEIARIDAIGIQCVADADLVHDMALGEEHPAVADAAGRNADLVVHCLLSLDGAAAARGQGGGHGGGPLEAAFRALEHELLAAFARLHPKSLLAAAELLPHRALAEPFGFSFAWQVEFGSRNLESGRGRRGTHRGFQ